MIELKNLTKRYGGASDAPAVKDVSVQVQRGEFFTLLGPSGCGKTTTLRCIAGLEQPDSGTITIGDRVVYRDRVLVPTFQRSIGMVFQGYAVWPHMSVFANAAFPLQVARPKPAKHEIARLVEARLKAVGLDTFADRPATHLSGGQQQRLALARALVREPAVLLLDEPLSNLDARLREQMRFELRELQQRLGLTTIFVTHDQVEALSMSDRIGLMKDGEIAQLGTPEEIYDHPTSTFAASFIGGTNLVPGQVVRIDDRVCFEGPFGEIHALIGSRGLQVGTRGVAAIKHEHVILRAISSRHDAPTVPSNEYVGRIRTMSFEGSRIQVTVSVGPTELIVVTEASRRTSFSAGDDVEVLLPTAHTRVLAEDEPAL